MTRDSVGYKSFDCDGLINRRSSFGYGHGNIYINVYLYLGVCVDTLDSGDYPAS